jgi:general stress protein 26
MPLERHAVKDYFLSVREFRWCLPRQVEGTLDERHTRPMTAQLDGERGPIWFFTAKDNAIVQNLGKESRAIATFASKGHDLFATVHGRLSLDNDRATIDRLWNRFVAAWFVGEKDDPNLAHPK